MKIIYTFLVLFFFIFPYTIHAAARWELKSEFEFQADGAKALDFNDDGIDEIMVTIDYTNIIKDQRGNILGQVNLPRMNFKYVDAVEFDGESPIDIVFQVLHEETLYVFTVINREKDTKFKVVPGKDITSPKEWGFGIAKVGMADLNKDSFNDFICFIKAGLSLQPRGIWVYDCHNERELWHFWMGGNPCVIGQFAQNLTDINGDGEKEIVFGTGAPCNGSFANGIDDFHSYVVVLDSRGNLVWKRLVGDVSTIALIWAGDIDKDSEVEVVACEEGGSTENKEPNSLLILNGKTGAIKRYIKTGEKFLGMEVCDWNRDGRLEIITGNSDGRIRIFNDSLDVIQETSFPTSARIHAACDFDGNGTTELLVSTRDSKVFILNERLETIVEEKMVLSLSGVSPFVINCGKKKKILFQTGDKSPYTYKLMSVVSVGPLPPRTPRNLFIVVTSLLILVGMAVVVNNYIQSINRIRRVKNAVDVLPQAIIMLDSKNRIIYSNSFAKKMFHKENKVLLKKPVNELVTGESFKPMLEWLKNSGNQVDFNFDIKSGDEVKKIEVRMYSIRGNRLIVFEDKTTKYTSERIISWAGFAQKLAHEVKNPLSTITLTVQRLQRIYKKNLGKESKKLDNYTDSILEEVERLRYTTDRFMRILSIEKPVFEPNDINLLIDNTLEKHEKTLPKKVEIKKSYDKDILPLRCDGNQIMVLLSNLIENALEAMRGVGTLRIKTVLIEKIIDKKIKKFVEINIEDTGEGISEDNLKNLFKPFYSTKEGGTGLGLLISRQIAEVHKGKIEIRSKQGIGTVVSVFLPIEGIEVRNQEGAPTGNKNEEK